MGKAPSHRSHSRVNGGNAEGDLVQNVKKHLDGIQGGKEGHVILGSQLADLMTVMDLVAQRVINEKKKTDDAKRAAVDDIA